MPTCTSDSPERRATRRTTGISRTSPRIVGWRLSGGGRDEQLRSLGELRRGVEPVAAGLAAVRATPDLCGALTGAVRDGRPRPVRRPRGVLAADIVVHSTLHAASGNEMLATLSDVVRRRADRAHPPPPDAVAA
jgi:DNA-binding FadR family transcriptional regulator